MERIEHAEALEHTLVGGKFQGLNEKHEQAAGYSVPATEIEAQCKEHMWHQEQEHAAQSLAWHNTQREDANPPVEPERLGGEAANQPLPELGNRLCGMNQS